MFGDYIARGSAGAVFSSPSDPNQVIKIFNLDAPDDMLSHMNRLQFQFFEELEAQQKQDLKTPGLPQINYTFTGKMTPEIMTQISDSLKPSEQLDYAAIKSNFKYGDKYAIILMDRVSKIGPQDYEEPLGRRGLTPMLRHAYQMGYYVRDLWPENKGMSSEGDIIWFDPMVAPVNPVTDQDREALKILFEWDEDRQRQYQKAVRDKSYFDYEHKAGLFYAEDNTAITNVTYKDVENPEWIAAFPRQMLLQKNTEPGINDYGPKGIGTKKVYEVMLGPDYEQWIKQALDQNPNGFLMTWAGSQVVGTIDLDNTFWVYPIEYEKVGGAWENDYNPEFVVMDGHHVMSYGKKGTYDSTPLTDLFDAVSGENPKYTLTMFKGINWPHDQKPQASINYTTLDKSFKSEDDNYWLRGGCGKAAAMISKDLDQKNTPYHYEIGLAYIEGAFMGNHIVVISEAGDQDHYGTQGAKKRWENMMLSELVDQELPASMVEDIITFEWHKVDPEKDWSVEIAGEYLPVSGPMITKDTLSMSAEDCSQCNRTNIDNDDNEYDEYCGGCGAYLCDECYDGGNNNLRWLMDWPHEWEPPYLSKHETQQHWNNELVVAACCLQKAIDLGFVPHYQTVESLRDVMEPYQYVSMNYVLGGLKKMSAESYPTCYLCPKPAKIEVMTAIGMRNFCGNKCRGDYEGIDYGPDDYYISPKLEHDIELVAYDPGNIGDRYSGSNRSATLSAKCRNCEFTTLDAKGRSRNQSFYQHHLVKNLREWDKDSEEWWDTGEKCRHDKMQYLDYLENGEDAWGNIIAGRIVIGCPTCGFKDTLDHVNIPQGCDNQGRIENYVRF